MKLSTVAFEAIKNATTEQLKTDLQILHDCSEIPYKVTKRYGYKLFKDKWSSLDLMAELSFELERRTYGRG